MMRYLLPLLLCQSLIGATYYVSPSGNDTTGNGSLATPWRQPSKAAAVVLPGDTVSLAAGSYSPFAITRSGSSVLPITWTGTLSGTNQVSIIDAGTVLSSDWVEDLTVAAGVYKHTGAPWQPGVLMADGARVYQLTLYGDVSDGYTFSQLLDLLKPAAAATTSISSGYWTRTDEYWDGVEASWTRDPSNGNLYIRFRNGDDPNSKEIKISSNGGSPPGVANGYGISLSADWNVIEKLYVKGANAAVLINTLADNNRIQDNTIESGQYGISIGVSANANNNRILRNRVFANMWGESPGDYGQWGSSGSDVGNIEVIRYRRYIWPKRYEYASTPAMINLDGSGAGTVAAFNYVHDASVAIGMGYWTVNPMHTGMIVASNLVSYMSSVGINLGTGQTEFSVFANTISNSNIGIRFQNLNANNASGNAPNGFIYRNVSINTNGFGSHSYWGYASGGTRVAAITNYHNTFTGGGYGIQISIAGMVDLLSGYRWHNNIWSCTDTFQITSTVANDADTWAAFTHNIVKDSAVGYPWWGTGNQQITSLYWPVGTWPTLTTSSTAVDSGVVLAGYPDIYSDTLPDRGALPYNPGPVLPLVSLAASSTLAFETGTPVTIRVSRTGSTAAGLNGTITIGGTAVSGVNYEAISTSWTIQAGSAYADILLTPINDSERTGDLTFTMSLDASAAYLVAGSSVSITMKDSAQDQTVPRTPALPGSFRPPIL